MQCTCPRESTDERRCARFRGHSAGTGRMNCACAHQVAALRAECSSAWFSLPCSRQTFSLRVSEFTLESRECVRSHARSGPQHHATAPPQPARVPRGNLEQASQGHVHCTHVSCPEHAMFARAIIHSQRNRT